MRFPAGEYGIELQLIKEGEVVCSAKQKVTVIGTELPKLDIMHTEWMHADCLADYYHVEVFSEEHWKLLENYFQEYVKRDCNMMLTPLFTSPLDTAIGLERTTCQLIDVEVKDGEYVFGFEKLKRWIDLCKKCGIEYFEMSHLFSQWGAKYAPKVVATVNGKKEKIFGWHTPAVGEYTKFLERFSSTVDSKAKRMGNCRCDLFSHFR